MPAELPETSPLISVVIATFNRAAHLEKCLATLDCQEWNRDSFEVIVVNDGSTDASGDVINRFSANCRIRFRTTFHENRGVSFSRNAGVAMADGQFVLFTDDDCRLPVWWIGRYAEEIASLASDTIGVGGPLTSVVEGVPSFAARFITYLDEFNYVPVLGSFRIYPVHTSRIASGDVVPYLRTSNALFRKDLLCATGGFDLGFRRPGGEDPDLCFRLLARGGHFRFDPGLVVDHVCRAGIADYFRTLANYVNGEFICRRNIELYALKAVQRNYEYIPLQKVCSLTLALAGYPLAVLKNLFSDRCGVVDAVLFPLLVVFSKVYALQTAVRCQFFR